MLTTKNKSALSLLEELQKNSDTAKAIMAYFAPVCNCDPAAFVKTRLQANDTVVLGLINALIARPEVPEPSLASTVPWEGDIISTSCTGANRTAVYADGAGGTYTGPLITNDPTCV